MSQVITKLQAGGSLTIDGIKYKATPEFINALTAHLRETAGTDAQTLAGLSNALLNGENLKYDSAANTISGMDGSWSGITDRQNQLRRTGSSNWRKWWEAQFDTDAHRFRNALSAISSFHYQVPKKEEETPTNLRDISSDKQWFEFTKGEDGKEKWNDSVYNASLLQRINDMSAYLKDPEAGKKAYRLGSGYTDAYMQAFQNLYNQDSANWDTRINEIIGRLKNGTYDDADRAFLNNFFIAKPDPTAEETAAATLAADKKRFADAGFDYDKWSPYLTWNSDKNYWNVSGAGQEAFRSAFGGNGNYWFNDNFIGSKYNPTGALDFLNGYFVLGDRIYKQSDAEDPTSELSQILRRNGGFRDLNAGMRHNEANALIEQLWGTPIEWEAPTGEYYSDWLDPNGNVYYRSRTGDYNWTGKDNNQQLVEWIAANPELADAFGYYTPQFKLTDKNGNELNKYGPEVIAGLTQLADSQRYESPFHRNKLWYSENGNSDFDGRYLLGDGVDDEGNVTGAGFWINPNDPNGDWIYESDEMKRYVPDIEGNAVRIPKEMVAILASNPDFIKNFQNDESGFRSKFAKVMAGAVGRGVNFSTFMANAGPQAWQSLGFDKETSIKLAQMCRQYSENQKVAIGINPKMGITGFLPIKSNRGKRRAERMVHKPTLHKEGGKVEKAGYGEMVGKSAGNAASPTQTKTDKPIRDTGNFTNFGEGKLQPHDWIELGAVAADAASIGFAFAPEIWTNVAAGATGMAGSTAGFIADVKRDGFDRNDLLQYGINLGLDTLSFIPVLGGFSKAEKVARGLQKSAKVIDKLMKAAALYGIPHAAVQSWDAIKNGKFNMRDLRAVVNAVGGAVHMGRSGFRKPVRGEASIEYPTINLKAGKEGNPIKLTESQFNTIQNANPKTKEELAEQIGKLVNKTKEQVLDEYNLTDFINHRDHRFGLFGKEVNKVKLNADKKKGKIQWQDMSKNPNRVQEHETYLANLAGRQPMSRVTNTVETITEPGVPTLAWRPKYKTTGSTIPARTEKYVMPDGTVKEVRYPGISDRRRVIVNEADKALPVPVPMVEKQVPRTIVENVIPRLMTPVTSGIVWERPTDPLKSPTEAIGPNNPNYSRGYMWNPVAQPVFRKKGGKIAKAQLGLNTAKLNIPTFNVKGLGTSVKDKVLDEVGKLNPIPKFEVPTFTPTKPTALSPELQNFRVTNPMTGQSVQSGVNTYDSGGDSLGKQNPYLGGGIGFNAKPIDPVPIMNTLSAGIQLGLLNKQLNRAKSVAAPQYQTFHENSIRFTGSPEADKLNDLARSILIGKDTSADSWENKANALNKQLASNNYKLDSARELSKAYSQNVALNEAGHIRNQERDTNMGNQNTELRYRKDLADAQMDSAAIANASNILNTALYAGTQSMSDEYNRIMGARESILNNKKLKAIDDEYRTRQMQWRKDFESDLTSDAAAQGQAGINAWLQGQMRGLQSLGLQDRIWSGNQRYLKINPRFSKKGGKLTNRKDSNVTYSRDPYPELLLQNAKDSTEIVKQLNDAVIKLLLQTKPINVH